MVLDKDQNQCNIEYHALHQHPHKGDQEPVVEKNSDQPATKWDSTYQHSSIKVRLDACHEYDLRNAECDTQLDVNVVPDLLEGTIR